MEGQPKKYDGPAPEPVGGAVRIELSGEAAAVVAAAEKAAAAVLQAAEQEVAAIRAEADDYHEHLLGQARQTAEAFLADHVKRIAEVSDPAIEAAERVLGRLDDTERLALELEARAATVGDDAASAAEAVRRAGAVPLPAPEQPTAPAEDGDGAEPAPASRRRFRRTGSQKDVRAARLAALQMAVAGSNRGEIEAHLDANFDHPEAFEVLDEVFGGVEAQI